MTLKICFVSPYTELTRILEGIFSGLPDPPRITEGAYGVAEGIVRMSLQDGYEVFVTTEKNARFLRTRFSLPFVDIPFTAFDAVYALHQAKKRYGYPIALFEFHSNNPYVTAFQDIIGCEIREFIINDQTDAANKLLKAKREGCKVAVTGGLTAETARKVGVPCVPLFPRIEAIKQAHEQAKQILEERREKQSEAVRFHYITQYSEAGVIMVDTDHRVTVFNSSAEKIFGFPAKRALGKPLQDLVPSGPLARPTYGDRDRVEELQVIGKNHVLISRIPIIDREEFVGTVFTVRPVDKERSRELKVGQPQASGLMAKSTFADIISSNNSIMIEVIEKARRIAATDETVLITGETGTGKELFAQGIHNASSRKDNAFVAVNCAAIPPSLIESELFGYAEGAFTGARRGGRQGMFELAKGGTIFLDEIGELPKDAQSHLLRVIQEKEIMRVGDNKVIRVDTRVIGATNQLLEEATERGLFRSDLYYRLNVLQLELPPLKEHSEDIPFLIHAFLNQFGNDPIRTAQIEDALQEYQEIFLHHSWRGNIRELQNIVRRLLAIVETKDKTSLSNQVGNVINEGLKQANTSSSELCPPQDMNIKNLISHLEEYFIKQQSEAFKGNKTMLAKKLGICRTTLWRKQNNRR
ncbi:MAG: sigma 54-interacting transcriptional regulator [Syntrophorhabdaceae bacterium]|nr:sigma 54-interacting transcriptional regulator [Syntrophorhabdaceae bacterium]MDD5242538.1 sigma 54-interacting transcriptional regulator [Syntrophorhabdaceae bacterium]